MKTLKLFNGSQVVRQWLHFTIPIILFCSFSEGKLTRNLNLKQGYQGDTLPVKELNNINWNNVERMIASNGSLIAKLNTDEIIMIARKDYEIFAKENGKISRQYDQIFTKMEIEPEFPGGADAWLNYVNNNMHYPKKAIDGNIQGAVLVQFIVDQEGSISDVEAVSGPVAGELRDEAVRLVKASGTWHPAIQNFRIVKAYKKQPVTFSQENYQQKITQIAATADSGSNKSEAEYPGGKQSWMTYLMKNIRYPNEALQNNIQGSVVVKFIVDEKGRIKNIEAVSGAKELQKEAIRVIDGSGRWIPAKENGKAIKSERQQIVTFKREFPDDNQQKNKTDQAVASDSSVTRTVDTEASYPGGSSGWMRYLNKVFRYPAEAQRNQIQGTVIVQFLVDKDGNVSNVEAVSGPANGGLREEVIRVIKRSGKWIPATLNGLPVQSVKKQPLTFKLESN